MFLSRFSFYIFSISKINYLCLSCSSLQHDIVRLDISMKYAHAVYLYKSSTYIEEYGLYHVVIQLTIFLYKLLECHSIYEIHNEITRIILVKIVIYRYHRLHTLKLPKHLCFFIESYHSISVICFSRI